MWLFLENPVTNVQIYYEGDVQVFFKRYALYKFTFYLLALHSPA